MDIIIKIEVRNIENESKNAIKRALVKLQNPANGGIL